MGKSWGSRHLLLVPSSVSCHLRMFRGERASDRTTEGWLRLGLASAGCSGRRGRPACTCWIELSDIYYDRRTINKFSYYDTALRFSIFFSFWNNTADMCIGDVKLFLIWTRRIKIEHFYVTIFFISTCTYTRSGVSFFYFIWVA